MPLFERMCLILADLVLMVHAGFVVFVVAGLILIWIGLFRGWKVVRNFWFRLAHLVAIGVVAGESIIGFDCPLTTWENRLRWRAEGQQPYAGSSFLQHWLHRVIFFEFPEHLFTITYIVFFVAVALTLWMAPPHWPRRSQSR